MEPLPCGQSAREALARLEAEVVACRRCPRLVAYRERVAGEKKPQFKDWEYWGRPVPGFGDPQARVLLVGLAPAAHGANRTGRMFTGDLPDGASAWLVRALHRVGLANQPTSIHRHDGLRLVDAYVTAAVRCAPPENRPTAEELQCCFPFLVREFEALPRVRVVVALGAVAFASVLRLLAHLGVPLTRPRPRFAHGFVYRFHGQVGPRPAPAVLCTYHPSRQNTQTGKLTARMLEAVLWTARQLAEAAG
ncbi:MAG: uracil-DNA glycosylase [candidate division GAL15 bacterium]